MYQTGFEFKKKEFTSQKIDKTKKSFDYTTKYNSINFIIKKEIKNSKKQEHPLSDNNLKKNLHNARSKSFCKTFINSCIKKLTEDEKNLKAKKINDIESKDIEIIFNIYFIS